MIRGRRDLDSTPQKSSTMAAAVVNSSSKSSRSAAVSTPNTLEAAEERQTKSGRKVKPPKALEDFEDIELPKQTPRKTVDQETPKKKLLPENIETTPRSAKKSRTLAESLLIEQTKMKIIGTPEKSLPTTPQTERKSARKVRTPAKLNDFERDETIDVKKSTKKAKENPIAEDKPEQPVSVKKSTRKTKANERAETPQKAVEKEEEKPVTKGKKSTKKIDEQQSETPKKDEPVGVGRKSTRKTMGKEPEELNSESMAKKRTTRKLDKELGINEKPITSEKPSSSDEEVANIADRTKSGRKVKKPAFPDDSPPKSRKSLHPGTSESSDVSEDVKPMETKSSRRKTKHEPKEVDLEIKEIVVEEEEMEQEEKKSRRKTKHKPKEVQEEIIEPKEPVSRRKTRHELKDDQVEEKVIAEDEKPTTSRSIRKKKIESPQKSVEEEIVDENPKPSRSRRTLMPEKSEDKKDEASAVVEIEDDRPKRVRKPTKRYEQEDDDEDDKKETGKKETPKKAISSQEPEVLQSPRRARKQILPEISKNAAEDIKIVALDPEIIPSKRAKRKTVANKVESPKKEEPESPRRSRKTIQPTFTEVSSKVEEKKEPEPKDAIPLSPSKRARKSVHPHVSPEIEFQEEIVEFVEPSKTVSTKKKVKKTASQSSSDEDKSKTPSKKIDMGPEISRSGRKIKRPAFMDDFEDRLPPKKDKRMSKVVHQTGDVVLSPIIDEKHDEDNVTKRSRKAKHIVKPEVVKETPEFEEMVQPEHQEDDIEKVLETIDTGATDKNEETTTEEKESMLETANDSIEKELEKMETMEVKQAETEEMDVDAPDGEKLIEEAKQTERTETDIEKTEDDTEKAEENDKNAVNGEGVEAHGVETLDKTDEAVQKVDETLDKTDEAVQKVDENLEEVDEKLEKVDEELEKVDEELEKVDEKLEKVDENQIIDSESEQINEEANDGANRSENTQKEENKMETQPQEELDTEKMASEPVIEEKKGDEPKSEHQMMDEEKTEITSQEIGGIIENVDDTDKQTNNGQQKDEINGSNEEATNVEQDKEELGKSDEPISDQKNTKNTEINDEISETVEKQEMYKESELVDSIKQQESQEFDEKNKSEVTAPQIMINDGDDDDEEFEKLQLSVDEDHEQAVCPKEIKENKQRESVIDLTDSPLVSKQESTLLHETIKEESEESAVILIPETPAPSKTTTMNETFTPEKEIIEIPDTPMVSKMDDLTDEVESEGENIDADDYEFDEEDFEDDDQMGTTFFNATSYAEKSILKTGRKRSFSFCEADARKKNVKFLSPLVIEMSTSVDDAPDTIQSNKEDQKEVVADDNCNVEENGKSKTNGKAAEKTHRKRSMSASYVHDKRRMDESGVRSGRVARIAPIKRTGSARKGVPDFKAIHEKQFKNMQSIVDYDQMKKQRAKEIAAIKSPGMHLNRTAQMSHLDKKVFQFGASSSSSSSSSKVNTTIHSTVQSKTQDRQNRHVDLSKKIGHTTDVNVTLKKRMEFCSKVRSNRRHDLLMKFRHEQEEKDKSHK